MMPEDWYPDDADMQDAMWEWIDSLSHEERDEFFGYQTHYCLSMWFYQIQ